jgi:hypothetical protein
VKKLAGAILSSALVVAGLSGMSAPAFAVTTFTTCSSVSGHASFNPGISNTKQSSHVTGSAAVSGCTGGGVTNGSLAFQGNTIPGNCATRSNPTPGQVVITGSFSINWKNGATSVGTSSGSLKVKSTSNPVQAKVITKITTGKFQGTSTNPTKGKVLVQLTPDTGQDCVYTAITGMSLSNVSGNKYVVASAS